MWQVQGRTGQHPVALARLYGIPLDEERAVVATGRYLGEGFDDPRLDTLFLALPISWKGTLAQCVGRLYRALGYSESGKMHAE